MRRDEAAKRGTGVEADVAAAFISRLRPGSERLLYAAEALAVLECASPGDWRSTAVTHVALVAGGRTPFSDSGENGHDNAWAACRRSHGRCEVALLGLNRGWFAGGIVVALPLGLPGVEVVITDTNDDVTSLDGCESEGGGRFLVRMPCAQVCEQFREEMRAALAAATAAASSLKACRRSVRSQHQRRHAVAFAGCEQISPVNGQSMPRRISSCASIQAQFTIGADIFRSSSWRSQEASVPTRRGGFAWLWSYHEGLPASVLPAAQGEARGRDTGSCFGEPNLRVLALTLNCGAASPPDTTMLEPLFARVADYRPAVIAVSLQEMCPLYLAFALTRSQENAAAAEWTAALEKALAVALAESSNPWDDEVDYTVLKSAGVHMVGLQMVIFIRSDLMSTVRGTDVHSVGSGPLGAGNKGCVAASFRVCELHACFLNSHLPAGGIESVGDRTGDMGAHLRQLEFGPERRNVFEHDLLVWAGDFNSKVRREQRFDGEKFAASRLERCPFPYSRDELELRRCNEDGPWTLFLESPVQFPPTYKRIPGVAGDQSFNTSRDAAWCDRILWWARGTETFSDGCDCKHCRERATRFTFRSTVYESSPDVYFSDHRPVSLWLEGKYHEEVAPDHPLAPRRGRNATMMRRLTTHLTTGLNCWQGVLTNCLARELCVP
eukprot:TRINITY_DN81597_c0_g1_i1.p1 TRINITY_DN81597_c0_g1~~TRINITY_DN81597_c0_g1_i1.p1  ORF type:complete len:666 (-),score=98.25 TRINITY_DN81597_c0_g1_i1:87-2084(-)